MKRYACGFIFAIVLAGCSSTSSVPSVAVGSTAPVASAAAASTAVTVSVAVNVPTNSSVGFVTVSAVPVNASSSAVTATSPCTNSGCTISISPSPDYDTFTVTLLDASRNQLLSGSFNADAGSIDGVTTSIVFGGDPSTAKLSIDPPDFTLGTAATAQLTVVAKDAQGRRIIGSIPFTTPIGVTSSNSGVVSLSPAQLTSPSSAITARYSGASSSPVTFTASTANTQSVDVGIVGPATVTSFGKASADAPRSTAEELDMVPSAPVNPTPLPGASIQPSSSVVDLSANFPPIGDQGTQQSCTAWSSTYSIRTYLDEVRFGGQLNGSLAPFNINPDVVYTPAFIFNALNGGQNVGINGLKAMRFLKYQGAVPWTIMPWSVTGITPPPNAAQFATGLQHRIAHYHTIKADSNALTTVKHYLAAGVPVFWAVDIDSNLKLLYTTLHGSAAIWSSQGTAPERHAMLLVGYDDTKRLIKFRNSWGTQFGDNGYGYVTYSFWPQIHGAEMFIEEP